WYVWKNLREGEAGGMNRANALRNRALRSLPDILKRNRPIGPRQRGRNPSETTCAGQGGQRSVSAPQPKRLLTILAGLSRSALANRGEHTTCVICTDQADISRNNMDARRLLA
ncbi:MAG TPA: hypothetical protein VFT74_21495, partial [Isosphaeraceae bacterium]|nr:hypothetical protein [Isosphaeraceae bacterium]